MKKSLDMMSVVLVFALILSSCASQEENSIKPPKDDIVSSVSNLETERKSNSDVKADTEKELARYQELYPNMNNIVDKATPIIQELENSNQGYREYVVDFSEAYKITLSIRLPEQLSIRLYDEGERCYADLGGIGVEPFYSSAVGICDKDNNIIGGISSTTIMYPDDLTPGADNSALIYQGLFTGMGNTWDIGYNPIYQTDTECTATTYISYPDYAIEDIYPKDFARIGNSVYLGGGERYFFNKAILSYNTEKLKYVAIEIDFDCITDEELLSAAKSIKLS